MAEPYEFLNRYVGLVKESTYGTDPASGYIYGEVDDESFAHRYDLLTRQDMSRPIASKSVTGTEYSEGGVNLAVQVDNFVGNLLYAFFPEDTVSTKQHTLSEPVLAATTPLNYPSFTFIVGRERKEHTYTGMVGNRLSMSANVGEYVMMSADFVGKSESGTAALGTTAVGFEGEALDALYFSNGTVKFDDGTDVAPAASASVKSFSFEINLNRDTDNAYALGDSTYQRAPPAQRREITGSIEFNTVLYGDQSLDEPDYDALIAADGLKYVDGTDPVITLTLNDESASDYLIVKFYKVRFEAPDASVSGRDTNTMTVNFVGLYDTGTNKAMEIVIDGAQLSATAYDA
jgi:hypothetical protein